MTAAKPKTLEEMEERLGTLYRRRQKAEQRLKKSTAEMRTLQKKIRDLEEEKFTCECRDFGLRLAKANLSPGQVNLDKVAQMVAANRGEYARPTDSPLPEDPLNPEDGREAE